MTNTEKHIKHTTIRHTFRAYFENHIQLFYTHYIYIYLWQKICLNIQRIINYISIGFILR